MIFLSMMLIILGCFIAGITGLVNPLELYQIPGIMRVMPMFIGIIMSMAGFMLLMTRAKKTGVIHLLKPSKPGLINWLYVHKSGEIEITPSVREIEGMLYSPKLDAMIHDVKRYNIYDHNIRVVAEGHGHAEDLGMCLYATYLKKKGFKDIFHARDATKAEREYAKEPEPKPVVKHTGGDKSARLQHKFARRRA